MISFKKWFFKENLQGPGGGPEPQPENQENLADRLSQMGVGAFPSFENNPIKKPKSAASKYADPRFQKKFMKSDGRLGLKKK